MAKDVVTSFRVDGDLWKKARIYAIENGVTMKELIESLLRIELKENKVKKMLREGGEHGNETKK
jgi:hypothetical protein